MKHKVISLFSGGGFLDIGFIKEGSFDIVWACDNDKQAVKAYNLNIGDHIRCVDITKVDFSRLKGKVDGILGGPPCQDFSIAGKGEGVQGERGKLVWDYLRKVHQLQPKWFLFENVRGLTFKKHRPAFEKLLELFGKAGYRVMWKVLDAWEYGVAQHRQRVFIVGIRKDLEIEYVWPAPWPESKRKVLRDVIGDLPEPQQQRNGGHMSDNYHLSYVLSNGITSMEEPSPTVTATHRCHYSYPMNHNPKELSAQYKKRIDEGIVALKKHPPSEMGEPSSSIVANIARGGYYGLVNHTLTESGIVKDEQKLSPQRGRKAGWANAGRTVTTNDKLDSTEIHPSYPRRFTVRECMRIQSIPDWYAFPDETTGVTDRKEKISLSAQYRIVGNGVPTLLAVQLARQLSRAFGLGEA